MFLLIFSLESHIGVMFHRKPLYLAIAQRKEERKVQLQLQYSRRTAMGFSAPSAPLIPRGYPPFYFPTPPAVPQVAPPRSGLMYQPLCMRPEWRGNGFAPTAGPAFQPPPIPVSTLVKLLFGFWTWKIVTVYLLVMLPHFETYFDVQFQMPSAPRSPHWQNRSRMSRPMHPTMQQLQQVVNFAKESINHQVRFMFPIYNHLSTLHKTCKAFIHHGRL